MVKRVGQKKRGKYSRKPKKIILIGTEGNNQTEKNILLLLIKLKVNIKLMLLKETIRIQKVLFKIY
ncbi:MAG: hypothetical protein ACI319_05880 [Holdemanella porci]